MSFDPVRFGPLRLLLLLSLLLTGGLAAMWFDQHAHLRNLAWVAPKALPPDIKVPAGPPKVGPGTSDAALFAVILERPLFAPDRRPPPPPPPPKPAPPPDPLADIQIMGIFSGENSGIIARIEGKMRRVKISEAVGSWTLKSIADRDVVFAQGDQNRKLRMAYARLDTPAPKAAAAVAKPPSVPGPPPMTGAANLPPQLQDPTQRLQDATRERLRRRNEIRASRGLPPLTE